MILLNKAKNLSYKRASPHPAEGQPLQLAEIEVRPIHHQEIRRYNGLMQTHHYLGALRPIGKTIRYVASWQNQWIALISFSSAALKCRTRDQWIGWSY